MTTVTVIVPAYNEGPTFAANLVRLEEQFCFYQCYRVQYIIVDDGSTDETRDAAEFFARFRPSVEVLTHDRHYGVAKALRSGLAQASGQYTVVVAADLSYSPFVAMELLEALQREQGDVALASPHMRGGSIRDVPLARRLLSSSANRFLSLAVRGRYSTLSCMVRAYRTAFLEQLEFCTSGPEVSAELLFAAIRKGATIVEVPARREWDVERLGVHGIPKPDRIVRDAYATIRLAFLYRPAIFLALPGAIPACSLFVIVILILTHTGAQRLDGYAVVIYLLFGAFGLFGGYFTRRYSRERCDVAKEIF